MFQTYQEAKTTGVTGVFLRGIKMQTILVIIILLIAFVFVGWRILSIFRKKGSMGCGCSDCSLCGMQASCDSKRELSEVDRDDKKE